MSRKKKRSARVPGMKARPRKPGWKVQLVGFGFCDEPGCTADHSLEDPAEAFGYTSGLHQRHRLPELHMVAGPDDGDGGNLGVYQVGEVLNRLADGVVARKYRSGSTVVVKDVDGFGDVVCQLGEPVPRDDVEAFEAHPRSEVIPITWATAPEHRHSHDRSITIGAREGAQVSVITYTAERIAECDSGFVLEYEGAPPPWELTQDAFGVVCMGCLIETQPEVGAGLDLARQHGAAELRDGRWVAVDLEEAF